MLERYRATAEAFSETDSRWNVPVLEALGELYEATGKPKLAIERYGEITELWTRAEPALQPKVKDIRLRIAKLVGSTG